MTPLLAARDLAKTYGTTKVLHGVDLDVGPGESVAILGQSGSGKTTLLSLLAGLEPPDHGRVIFDGGDINALGPDALARLRGRNMGIIFQEYHLVPSLTARENVSLPLEILGKAAPGGRGDGSGAKAAPRASAPRETAERLLGRVGLAERGHHYPHQLSGGEQQRVAIARALAAAPRLLFADEPTGNLDEATAEGVEALIFSLIAEEGLAAVIVTHNRELAARCSRTLTLHLGRFAP